MVLCLLLAAYQDGAWETRKGKRGEQRVRVQRTLEAPRWLQEELRESGCEPEQVIHRLAPQVGRGTRREALRLQAAGEGRLPREFSRAFGTADASLVAIVRAQPGMTQGPLTPWSAQSRLLIKYFEAQQDAYSLRILDHVSCERCPLRITRKQPRLRSKKAVLPLPSEWTDLVKLDLGSVVYLTSSMVENMRMCDGRSLCEVLRSWGHADDTASCENIPCLPIPFAIWHLAQQGRWQDLVLRASWHRCWDWPGQERWGRMQQQMQVQPPCLEVEAMHEHLRVLKQVAAAVGEGAAGAATAAVLAFERLLQERYS